MEVINAKSLGAVIPTESDLSVCTDSYDYIDCFEGTLKNSGSKINSVQIGKAFFSSGPKWIDRLFALRNRIVKLFGLKTPGSDHNRERQIETFAFQPGERLGLFRVFSRTERELVIGEDDKHLDFRVSLMVVPDMASSNQVLTITTVVKFHNWFGRLYFLPVKPFHRLIVPTMLDGIVRELSVS